MATQNTKVIKDWYNTLIYAGNLQILYPDTPMVDNEEWQMMLDYLADIRRNRNFTSSYRMAAEMRKLRDDPALSPMAEEWTEIKKELNEFRAKKDYNSFFGAVERAKILAAQKVKVTDKGLEFEMKRSIAESESQRTPPESLQI